MVYDLECIKKASVMKHDKSKSLGIPYTSHPSSYGDLFIQIFFSVFCKSLLLL